VMRHSVCKGRGFRLVISEKSIFQGRACGILAK